MRPIAALLVLIPLSALAADRKLSKAQVPSPVAAAVEAKYAAVKPLAWSSEVEAGKTGYEAKLADGREVTVSAEGKILSEESKIEFAQVPVAVQQAFAASKYGHWKVRKAEKILEGERVSYEIAARHGKSGVEVVFDGQGKIVKEEKTSSKND